MSDWLGAVRPRGKLERTMNHSLIGAGRTTHLKILCVALLGAIAVVAVGTSARVAESERTQVVKAGKPATFTAHAATAVR
jgi:hypothetical protein